MPIKYVAPWNSWDASQNQLPRFSYMYEGDKCWKIILHHDEAFQTIFKLIDAADFTILCIHEYISYTNMANMAVNKIYTERDRYRFSRAGLTIVHISNQLWRHQQNVNHTNETRGRSMREDRRFIVIYGFVMSWKVIKNVHGLLTNCLCSHANIIFVFIALVASQHNR